MPRVVPSQIVEFIDAEFPFARSRQPSTFTHADIDALSALVRLTEELPDELRTVSGRNHSFFLRGIETIRGTVTSRIAFASASHAPLDERLRNEIADVREILEPLPDEAPLRLQRNSRSFPMPIFAIASATMSVQRTARCMTGYGKHRQYWRALRQKLCCAGRSLKRSWSQRLRGLARRLSQRHTRTRTGGIWTGTLRSRGSWG